jgi:hypothetical protein
MYYQKTRIKGRHIAMHTVIVEKALGRSLKDAEQIHHWDENKKNNAPENLVLCPDTAYHALLHVRTKALDSCGNANFRKCFICKQYDDPKNMYHKKLNHKDGGSYRHRRCHNLSRSKIQD